VEKRDVKYHPHTDYIYWLYDPEGDGMTYYRTQEDRDEEGKKAVKSYLSYGEWEDEVRGVAAGTVTHRAQFFGERHGPDNLIGDYLFEPSVLPG